MDLILLEGPRNPIALGEVGVVVEKLKGSVVFFQHVSEGWLNNSSPCVLRSFCSREVENGR